MVDPEPRGTSNGDKLWPRLFWPGFILALLGGQILVLIVMVYFAAMDGSFAVEPDYYQKALNWDKEVAQLRENERLNWSLQIDVGDEAGVLGERVVTCTLRDREGKSLDGAVIQLLAFPHARGVERTTATLEPRGNGAYETTLRLSRKGLWEFRLRAQRGPETFSYTEQRDVYPPGESRPWRP